MQDYELLDVLSNKRVLCLEDEPGILKNITESLQLFFGEVVGVKDGLEALDEAMQERVAGILAELDVSEIIVSHDKSFIDKIADKIYYLKSDGLYESP